MLPHPWWGAGLEEQPLLDLFAAYLRCAVQPLGVARCTEDLTTNMCSGRDVVKMFLQHFIQAEIYSKRKGLKSVGINGESV